MYNYMFMFILKKIEVLKDDIKIHRNRNSDIKNPNGSSNTILEQMYSNSETKVIVRIKKDC